VSFKRQPCCSHHAHNTMQRLWRPPIADTLCQNPPPIGLPTLACRLGYSTLHRKISHVHLVPLNVGVERAKRCSRRQESAHNGRRRSVELPEASTPTQERWHRGRIRGETGKTHFWSMLQNRCSVTPCLRGQIFELRSGRAWWGCAVLGFLARSMRREYAAMRRPYHPGSRDQAVVVTR
jgi:hypothetical protein